MYLILGGDIRASYLNPKPLMFIIHLFELERSKSQGLMGQRWTLYPIPGTPVVPFPPFLFGGLLIIATCQENRLLRG